MKFTYNHFRIFIHLLVAFVFLSELLELYLPEKIYIFLKENKDIVLGCYYVYLSYEIYSSVEIEIPPGSPTLSMN
jgi:hypothetical protein